MDDALERGWCVFQAKWHDQPLVVTAIGDECSLFDALGVHLDVPISPGDIQCGEVLGTAKTIDDVVNPGNRHFIVNCDLIEPPKIDAQANRTVFLALDNHRKSPRTRALSDQTFLEQFLDSFVDFVVLSL